MSSKLIVKTDITDWRDECLRYEPTIRTVDDLVALVVDENRSTGEAARMAIVMRELGHAPDDILKPNKLLLHAGGRAEVAIKVSARKVQAEMPNGSTYSVREFVGIPGRGEGVASDVDVGQVAFEAEVQDAVTEAASGPHYVPSDSADGLMRAMNYLVNTIPGYIFERLKIIALAGGDVEAAADTLKEEIDRQVMQLTEPIGW